MQGTHSSVKSIGTQGWEALERVAARPAIQYYCALAAIASQGKIVSFVRVLSKMPQQASQLNGNPATAVQHNRGFQRSRNRIGHTHRSTASELHQPQQASVTFFWCTVVAVSTK